MLDYTIRPIEKKEIVLLEDFLYEAIFQREGAPRLPRTIICQPEIRAFIDGFGKPADHCLVAELEGKLIGAVWTRILSGTGQGFAHVDSHTPEFAVSLYPEYRGNGIGSRLMREMLELLRREGYPRACLSVQKDNYAVKMYAALGFQIIRQTNEEYIMLYELQAE